MAFAFYGGYLLFRPYIGVILFALIIVITFYPVYGKVQQRLGRWDAWAPAVTITIVIITLLTPLFILGLLAINEITLIVDDIIYFELISNENIDKTFATINR